MPDPPRKPVVNRVDSEKSVVADHIGEVHVYGAPPTAVETPTHPRLTPPRNLPERNDKFAGRTEELRRIHELLTGTSSVGVSQQTAAHGHGGVGKTAVAIEYAWRHLDDYPGGLFIISCDRDLLMPVIVDLADHLGVEEADTPEQTAQRVKEHLEAGEAALLILDNVRDGAQWADAEWSSYLPGGNCRRLITTRSSHLPGLTMYPIERLPRDQGVELLARHRPDAGKPENEPIVGDIVDWFDGLAVGLTIVGAYMSLHEDLTWGRYAESLDKKGLGTVRKTEEAVTLRDYDKRVDAVFDETFEALDPVQQRALEYAALLPEDTVLRIWLTWLLENDSTITLPESPGYEDRPAEPVVSDLIGLQLLRAIEGAEGTLSLHRVLRRRLNEKWEEKPDQLNGLLDRIAALAEVRGGASHAALTDKSLRPELSALLELSDALLAHDRTLKAAILANWLHTPLEELARYAEDCASLMRFIADGACTLEDEDSTEAATLLSNLALTLQDLGDLPAAREHMERVISIKEKHFEPHDPTFAVSYSNLAMILRDLGHLPAAREQMERAIEIDEKHFDPDHPKLAIRYSNLAVILQALRDFPAARKHMERAIKIEEKHFEPDHPDLAISYSNLATMLQDLAHLPEAREYMERAIEIGEKHFDPDHPKLATRYNSLAHIELADGHHEKACELWRRAYAIRTKHFDQDHPSVRTVAESLRKHCGGVPN